MSDAKAKAQPPSVQTTGHAWDGDLQEFNNPLPRWWLWAFYATVVFAVVYWIFYPAWPVGDTFTKGVMNRITFTVNGDEHTTHWNTRSLLMKEMQEAEEAQRPYLERVAQMSYGEILADPQMMAFARSVAKGLFGDNCAPCHGQGGAGKVGLFPNLADDAWLWGGTVENIEQTITHGRRGFMPAFRDTFSDQQLDAVGDYVLSLSGYDVDTEAASRGQALFNGQGGGCYYCHTTAGTGLESQGAANLTDNIWTVADVRGDKTVEANKEAVKDVVRNGVTRLMPAWSDRLSPTDIKLITVYVHELGGGR
jgi:cytochrome c oxidase cbb3-type subunit 3